MSYVVAEKPVTGPDAPVLARLSTLDRFLPVWIIAAMAAGLLRHLTPEMLLLLDRGFYSYELWRQLERRGVKLLTRVVKSLVLRPIRGLADGSYLAKLYRNASDRQEDRDGITVRVIRYTLDDEQRVGHGEVHVLITNLLDESVYPAPELIMLYHERWEQELVFDEVE